MLRLIHNQTVQGAVLVDDIDDGLPNKQYHRLGSTADPKAYVRDGYANKPKQPCYIPLSRAGEGFPLIAGYIDLNETDRVTLSAGKGKIKGLQDAGYLDVVSFVAADVAAPTLAVAEIDTDLTLTGTNLLSVEPDITTVIITGDGAVTLTLEEILAEAGSSASATEIVIPAALIGGVTDTTSSVQVQANEQLTAVVVVTTP